jgi:AcrR family transcriptional regulator
MPGENKKCDRRVIRTRRSLSEALTGLILKKRYDSITVQEVINRANVGRSTFYVHYRSKDDLFLSDWKRLLDWFVSRIEWEKAGEVRFMPVLELFRHVQEFRGFYKALTRSKKTNFIFKMGVDYLSVSIQQSLTKFLAGKPQPSVPVDVISTYMAGQILTLLNWWAEHDMHYQPEQMDEMFHQLVVPGFVSALRITERKWT